MGILTRSHVLHTSRGVFRGGEKKAPAPPPEFLKRERKKERKKGRKREKDERKRGKEGKKSLPYLDISIFFFFFGGGGGGIQIR